MAIFELQGDMFKEMWKNIVMDYKAELIKKDQHSRRDIVTTNADYHIFKETKEYIVTDHPNQESQKCIVMGHKAELFTKDQPSRGNITTYAGKDVNKDRRAFLKAANAHDPSSFAKLDRLGR